MKKLLSVLMGLFVISGCSSSSSYNVELVDIPVFIPETPSKVSFKITEENQPAIALNVKAYFEMSKMDHDPIEVLLEDQGKGTYTGEVSLPMDGEWQSLLTMSVDNRTIEETVAFTVEKAKDDVVAVINGNLIYKDDIEFYKVVNRIQVELNRKRDQQRYQGDELAEAMKYWDNQEKALTDKNGILTQIIRLQAMALLAEEKGHKATDEEIQLMLNQTQKTYSSNENIQQMIQEYSEEKFWSNQEKQHKYVVLAKKVEQDILDLVKQANPEMEEKEAKVLAEKKYEELLVSQVGTLDIKLN